MKESQLVELLSVLTPAERLQLREYAAIAHFNGGPRRNYVWPLLEWCNYHLSENPKSDLPSSEAYNYLFPDETPVDGKLEKVMVDAQKFVRAVMHTWYYLRSENEFQQMYDLSEVMRLRGLESRQVQILNRLEKQQKESIQHQRYFFHHQFLLEHAIFDHESLYNKRKGDLNIPNVLDALESHRHLNELPLLNVYLLQKRISSLEVTDRMQTYIDNYSIPEHVLEVSPRIRVQYTIFGMLVKEHLDSADAQHLFEMLLQYERYLDPDALQQFYTYLRNFCVMILLDNPEAEGIYEVLSELYRDNLDRGFLHHEGKLHPSRYLAVSEYAARAKQHDWALGFIEKYRDEIIGENETRDIYRLNKAYYLFGAGRFEECLDQMPDTSPYTDYLIAGKRLEIKCMYELDHELLTFRLDAFRVFLSRTSHKMIPDHIRQKNMDFVNMVAQFISSVKGDKERSARLMDRLREKKQAFEWLWLAEKAREIEIRR